jgi:hypothetical protein
VREEGTARWEAIRGAMDMYICNAYIYNIQLDIYTYTDMYICNAYIYNIQLDIYTYVYTPKKKAEALFLNLRLTCPFLACLARSPRELAASVFLVCLRSHPVSVVT